MFKSLIVINVLILVASGEDVPVVASNETFVAIGSNSNETIESSTVSIEHAPQTIKTTSNDSSSAAYAAQFNPKLLQATNNTLVNTQARTIELTRNSLVQTPVNSPNGAVNSTSLLLILTSLIVVTCVVLIILTALFIMRRRFSIWRLNNSKLNLNGDSPNGTSSNEESKHDDEESGKKSDNAASADDSNCLTTVENKQSIMDTAAAAAAPEQSSGAKDEDNQCHLNQAAAEETSTQPDQSSPADDQVAAAAPASAATVNPESLAEQQQHISSTSSLIVNVLNELSESVAAKLAAKSPTTRSTHSANDPEKQPLNE